MPITRKGKMRKPSRLRKIRCQVCKEIFETQHSQGKYCSDKCRRDGARKNWRDYSTKNRERRIKYLQKYYEKNKTSLNKRTGEYKNTDDGKRAQSISQKKSNPLHIRARRLVKRAIKSGALIKKPCVRCGNKKVEAHHTDYSKPLDVVWLCRPHHLEEHRRKD